MVDEYADRTYKPFHFLILAMGSVNTQGPFSPRYLIRLLRSHPGLIETSSIKRRIR